MDLAELSVRRPVLMTMVYVLISVIALVFLPRLDMALYPDVDLPVISVNVDCGDAGPEEVELQVTEIMEDSLDSLQNLDTMTSISREGRASIILEFDYGTDLDDAAEDVNTIVSMLSRRLPDWAENPTVMRFDSAGSGSIMRLTITGDRTKDELQYIAENTVQPLIERIDGVSQVNVYGGANIEYEVEVDPNRLEAYGLTLSQISGMIASRNIQSTGGEITQDGMDYQIMTDARYFTLEDIRETIIGYTSLGTPILLQDVADVREGNERGGRLNYIDGQEVVTISVSNESDSNETTVAKNIKEELPLIQAELPEDITLTIQRDSTEMITATMDEVFNSAVQGVILAALIIFQIPDIYRLCDGRGEDNGISGWNVAACVVGLAVMVAFLFLGSTDSDISLAELDIVDIVLLFIVGVLIALSKIVPGLSGAAILLAIGLYTPLMDLVGSMDMSVLMERIAALVPIGLGLIAGVLGLSRIVDYFFRTHRRSAYWCIMGITVGSVVTVVVQALQGMESGMVPATIVCIAAGLVFGYVLSRVSSRYAEETMETEPA